MFENPRRGRQARNFTTNVPKILDLKSSSEQIFFRKLSLGAPEFVLWKIAKKLCTSFGTRLGTQNRTFRLVSVISRSETVITSRHLEITMSSFSNNKYFNCWRISRLRHRDVMLWFGMWKLPITVSCGKWKPKRDKNDRLVELKKTETIKWFKRRKWWKLLGLPLSWLLFH